MSPGPIRVLSDSLVGRIAAGEVVERPAAAVKEIVENALDAGASRVEVEIVGGTTGTLRVSDDGEGIPAEQLPLAVQRHATSKIASPEDLDRIATLGFRGEGLAAVGAVSRLRITSRAAGEEAGAALTVEDGRIGRTLPAARTRGTTVEVRDLFFNTPARRKYLKSPAAEVRAVVQLLQAYGFAHPTVSFSLRSEGKALLHLAEAADQKERLVQILGRNRVDRMIPILAEEKDVRMEGFLGAPEDSRARSGHQVFLLNGRWVTSPLLRQSVRMAYGDLIPPGRHAEAFLELQLPEGEIDVNVHPTKKEVRLRRERDLYPRLIRLLRTRVEGHFPALKLGEEAGNPLPADLEPPPGASHQESLRFFAPPSAEAEKVGWVSDREADARVLPFPSDGSAGPSEDERSLATLWQLHETYILARIRSGLLVIDQHAAHERVLYEEALRRFQGEPPVSQELLFPTVVELAADEFGVLLEAHDFMEKLGFHLEPFGGTSVLVHAIPAGVREWKHGALLKDVLDHLSDLPGSLDMHERVARSVACHGAVKAGQTLSLKEMNELVDQLFATEKPQGDPHGRPVFLRMDLAELHRRFGRSG